MYVVVCWYGVGMLVVLTFCLGQVATLFAKTNLQSSSSASSSTEIFVAQTTDRRDALQVRAVFLVAVSSIVWRLAKLYAVW